MLHPSLSTSMAGSEQYPLYWTAIILPAIAFPAWILCIPPLIWHYMQRNVAAWSLILWIMAFNFFNSINPLIWPRDNIHDWWDGNVLCDIEIRVFVGGSVALAACTTMIMRKLAKVMDTRNITLAPSRNQRIREKVLEVLWCWGYPVFMMLVYYIVQPMRYYIFGISGCTIPYNLSWVSIVLGAMWPAITICFAAYYAGLLVLRLYRYRREFHQLISAQNTTKSRFIRLFVMSMIVIVVLIPYSFWLLWLFASQLDEEFSWGFVHGPDWNRVEYMPVAGQVRVDKWGQISTGYIAFFVFGTGVDANNTYKRMLCAIGLGRFFPSLYRVSHSGTSTPSSFTFARGFYSTCASKAKSLFTRTGSITETIRASTRINSMSVDAIVLNTPRSESLQPVSTAEPILHQNPSTANNSRSPVGSFFTRRNRKQPILPLFTKGPISEATETKKSPVDSCSPGIYTHAWASERPTAVRTRESDEEQGVHIVREVHQDHRVKHEKGKSSED